MRLSKPTPKLLLLSSSLFLLAFSIPSPKTVSPVHVNKNPKIQAAILLDVSGSMDGLIEQAKAQLWNMVSVMGKAQCNNLTPQIEIALYEYGRSSNSVADGYVKQLSAFSTDLDQLSKVLFSLRTNGGDEYCGQVIYTSLNDLQWDTSSSNYKVIFIAGNEDFLQGKLLYTRACDEARKKGVIVNTIYCGDRAQGIREHWNLAGDCGNGSFTVIDHGAEIEDIATPYDSSLFVLNQKLNSTYIGYGAMGAANMEKQAEMDRSNMAMSKGVMAQRVAVKGKSSIYRNSGWDLVDAAKEDSTILTKVDLKTLPEGLKNKSRAEVKTIVKTKAAEREKVQQEIEDLNSKREVFIVAERTKNAGSKAATLETEVERIIRQQAARFNMVIQ